MSNPCQYCGKEIDECLLLEEVNDGSEEIECPHCGKINSIIDWTVTHSFLLGEKI